jgi:hypothetical protein
VADEAEATGGRQQAVKVAQQHRQRRLEAAAAGSRAHHNQEL